MSDWIEWKWTKEKPYPDTESKDFSLYIKNENGSIYISPIDIQRLDLQKMSLTGKLFYKLA